MYCILKKNVICNNDSEDVKLRVYYQIRRHAN